MTITTQTGTAPPDAAPLRTAALDICYGTRPALACGGCRRPLPPLTSPRLELELPDESVLCEVCASRAHKGLRLVIATFNHVLDLFAAGDEKAATETLQALVSAAELTSDRTATAPTRNRQTRRHPGKTQRRRR